MVLPGWVGNIAAIAPNGKHRLPGEGTVSAGLTRLWGLRVLPLQQHGRSCSALRGPGGLSGAEDINRNNGNRHNENTDRNLWSFLKSGTPICKLN